MWSSEKAVASASPTWDRNHRECEFKVEALEASGTLRCVEVLECRQWVQGVFLNVRGVATCRAGNA